MSLTRRLLLAACAALFAYPLPTAAQTPAGAPPAGAPPVDQSEGGGSTTNVMRIGSAVFSASAWLDAVTVTGDTDDEVTDSFRVRRARVGLAGSVNPRVGWSVSAELTAQPSLRNAFLVVKVADQLSVRMGQANPIGALERGTSPLALELIDRSPVTNELTGPADIGITLFNPQPYRTWLGYALNITNGSGFSRPDDNDSKDVSGRIALMPPGLAGLTVVASGARGEQPLGLRTRAGLGAEFARPTWRVMAEALWQERDRLPVSTGWVAMAVYRYQPEVARPHFQQLEFAARLSVLNDHATAAGRPSGVINDDGGSAPLTEVGIVTTREFQAGVNYYLTPSLRLMGDVVVPVDERQHPGPSALARWQLVF